MPIVLAQAAPGRQDAAIQVEGHGDDETFRLSTKRAQRISIRCLSQLISDTEKL